jgi:hypothetical protein
LKVFDRIHRSYTYDGYLNLRFTLVGLVRLMSTGTRDSTIVCSHCGHAMRVVRIIPKLGELPELLIFLCPSCAEIDTLEAKQAA